MSTPPPVLIAGAGPTGLTVAVELARRGVPVRVFEKRAEPSTKSKALVVHARTLEFFDLMGIADDVVRAGYTSPGIDFSSSAEHPLRATLYDLDTRFPFILILPQAETERFLEGRLTEASVEVERRSEVTAVEETASGVRVTVERDGQTETVEGLYLVGADGPHSTVRDGLGLPFEGSDYEWTATLGDVWMDGHRAEGGTEQHTSDRGLAFVVPFKDGSHRIVTIDDRFQGGEKAGGPTGEGARDLSLEDLQESISAILGTPVTLRDPKWLTTWGATLKLVPRYRVGRVFLAGDACHTHSPAGGQGMNTGIQDAVNLGWKLALVARGDAPEALLDTYHPERHPVGEKILRMSDLLLRSLLLHTPAARTAREALFRLLVPLPPVERTLAENLSGVGVAYDSGRGPLAGRRLSDVEVADAEHRPVRLYKLMRPGDYTLVAFVSPDEAVDEADALGWLVRWTEGRAVRPVVVLNNGLPAHHDLGADVLVDYKGEFERTVGEKTGRVLLVRPDGHVAVDLDRLDAAALAEAAAPWASPAVATV